LRGCGGARHRQGHCPRRSGADLRTVLHPQAQRNGDGPRHQPQHRRGTWRMHQRAQPIRARIDLPGQPAGAGPGGPSDRRGKVMNDDVMVCVVDDDERVRNSLSRLLKSAGYRTTTYPSAQALLAEPWAAGDTPTVVLTDLRMPGIDGIALAEQLA